MKIAYFDCFSGISGDMCLGALVAAGVPLEKIREGLASLPVEGYNLHAEKVLRSGISAVNVYVEITEKNQPERHLNDILEIIESSSLPPNVIEKSAAAFKRLAAAESLVHGVSVEKVHFHEVGAVDAIVDVVGTVLGLHILGVERVYASPLPLGRGFVECAHGVLPLPTPATLEILKGSLVYGVNVESELVTPTGAALITSLAGEMTALPPMRIENIGYGAGKRILERPNLLRLVVGTLATESGKEYTCRERVNGEGAGDHSHVGEGRCHYHHIAREARL